MASIPTFLPFPRGEGGGVPSAGEEVATDVLPLLERLKDDDRAIVEAMAPATAPMAMACFVISLLRLFM